MRTNHLLIIIIPKCRQNHETNNEEIKKGLPFLELIETVC